MRGTVFVCVLCSVCVCTGNPSCSVCNGRVRKANGSVCACAFGFVCDRERGVCGVCEGTDRERGVCVSADKPDTDRG